MRVVFIKVTKCEDKVGLFGFIHLCLGNLKEKGMKSGGSEFDFWPCDLCGFGKWLNCCVSSPVQVR